MKRPSSSNDFNFDDLDEFDWSIIQDGFQHPVQPYLKKTKMITLNNPIKIVRTGKCYSSEKNSVRTSTEEGKESLNKFKKKVLDRCQSFFGTFYSSCFDELLGFKEDDFYEGKKCEDEEEEELTDEKRKMKKIATIKVEMDRRSRQSGCLNKFIVYNEPNRSREGPVCKCSKDERKTGMHHGCYPGEKPIPHCIRNSNNLDKLHHYVLKVFKMSKDSALPKSYIELDDEVFYFEGFSIFLHEPYPERFPATSLNGLYDDYVWELVKEPPPTHFTIEELEAFHDYLFGNILEIFDLKRFPFGMNLIESCPFYHCYPRFSSNKKKEKRILSMSDVLDSLRRMLVPISKSSKLDKKVGQLFLNPEKRPKTIRIDKFGTSGSDGYPKLVHNTVLPSAMFSSKDSELFRIFPRIGRGRSTRFVDISFSGKGFFETGLFPDFAIHGLHLIGMIAQIRIRWTICHFENTVLNFRLKDPITVELALMHPSFKASYGTNASQCRTALANCGYFETAPRPKKTVKRRGFETLLDAMNVLVFGNDKDFEEEFIFDNERLEFLGDAVVGFVTTTRLFLMYPYADEGFLATSRSALVRNETLAYLAKKLGLNEYLLHSHSSDPSNQMDVDHALANAFEALMGAIFLDKGARVIDKLLGKLMFEDSSEALEKWSKPKEYLLKIDYPEGDRHLIDHIEYLKNLTELEENIGIYFKHIRILARVFTKRCIGDNFLTMGDNQTLEFLGDSVLQLAITIQLYLMFPFHNEGNMSLLRSCLVSNHTQSLICDDLGFEKFVIIPPGYESQLFTCGDIRKDKADLMEAFLGALYIDKGLDACCNFCDVCYFPRLKRFIISQTWNDPKSLLQQCCLLLRSEMNEKPHVPVYKLLSQFGPTNARQYIVGVYIAGNRLAEGVGTNMKQAEMDAAAEALLVNAYLFPISAIAKSLYSLRNQETVKEPPEKKSKTEEGIQISGDEDK